MRTPRPELIFLSHYPTAKLERHVGNDRRAYYLVRVRGEQMWSGCGKTPARAWRDACERFDLTDLKTT